MKTSRFGEAGSVLGKLSNGKAVADEGELSKQKKKNQGQSRDKIVNAEAGFQMGNVKEPQILPPLDDAKRR